MDTPPRLFGGSPSNPPSLQAPLLKSAAPNQSTGIQVTLRFANLFSPEHVVYFDINGDTRLLAQDAFGLKRVFIVSSRAMMFVCDAWNRMLALDGHFKEAQVIDGKREISFPGDDANALSILLNIAQLRFDKVPTTISFQRLLAISVLAEKYGAGRAFQPWLTQWINSNLYDADLPGYEEWLWIAWAFGERAIFTQVASRLIREARVNDAGQCLTSAGRVLDPTDDKNYFPPDIIENILRIRTATISELLKACYKYLDKYLNNYAKPDTESICTHSHGKKNKECDSKILGSFIISLRQSGLGVVKEDPSNITWSVDDLSHKLSNITVCSCCRGGSVYGRDCNFASELRVAVESILASIPSAEQDSHIRHMERQRRHF